MVTCHRLTLQALLPKVLGYITISTVKLWKVFLNCVGLEPVLFRLSVIIFKVWLITFNHTYTVEFGLSNLSLEFSLTHAVVAESSFG